MVSSMAITSITSWLTPSVLFCVLNLMIAIIFIASNFKSPHDHHHPPSQLVRSPSLLERVKSVNFSSFYATTQELHDINDYNSVGQLGRPPSFLQRVKSIDLSFSSFYTPPVDLQIQPHELHDSEQTHFESPSQLTRVPSLLERVKSFKVSSPFNSLQSHELQDSGQETHHDSPSQLTRVPSLLERVKSFKVSSPFNSLQSHELQDSGQETHYDSPSQLTRVPSLLERVKSFKVSSPFNSLQSHELQDSGQQTHHDSPSQLTRVPSLLERVKSFKLPYPFNPDHHSGAGDISSTKDEHSDSDMDRDRNRDPLHDFNESETSDVTPAKKPATTFTKSRSEKRWPESDEEEEEDVNRRRPATMKAAIGGKDECVDAKADDFIKRFKQQLKLQRLDSLQRFREMLNRGASA